MTIKHYSEKQIIIFSNFNHTKVINQLFLWISFAFTFVNVLYNLDYKDF